VTLRVGSLFSGVGGFDLGLERAGMTTVFQVEWDDKCQSVLRRHWPDVPKWHDVSDVRGADLPTCDVLAFGSPCQDLSIAGKRAGMVEGETRSGLFYEAIRIIEELQDDGRGPTWVVWENVAGALSSGKPKGADFGAVLDTLAELGAVDIQWRVLDAQFFGVPQRRRRVFVVARFGAGAEGGSQVLPLGARVRRDSASGRGSGQGTSGSSEDGTRSGRVPTVAGTLGGGSGQRGWPQDVERMTFIPDVVEVSALTATGVGTCGADDNQAQAGHLVPMTDTDERERERERDDSRPTDDRRDSFTGGASRRRQRPGRLHGSDHPDLPDITGTVTSTWAKGPGNTQVDEGLVIPVRTEHTEP